jgi:hypothetical protein
MKFKLTFTLLLALNSWAWSATQEVPTRSIALIQLKNSTEKALDSNEIHAISTDFAKYIDLTSNKTNLEMRESQHLDVTLNEKALEQAGVMREGQTYDEAGADTVTFALYGDVKKVGSGLSAEARLISMKGYKVYAIATAKCDGANCANSLGSQLAKDLIQSYMKKFEATISVSGTPHRSKILLNGIDVGWTPYETTVWAMGDAFKIQISDNGFNNFDTNFVPKAKKAHSIQFNLSRTDNFIRDSIVAFRQEQDAANEVARIKKQRQIDSIQAVVKNKRNVWRWTMAGISSATFGLGIFKYSEYMSNENKRIAAEKDWKNATSTTSTTRDEALIRYKNADKYAKTAFMIAATSLSLGVLGGSGFFIGIGAEKAWMVWDF